VTPLPLEEHEAWAGLIVSDSANGSLTAFTQIDRPLRVYSVEKLEIARAAIFRQMRS
jgi:hypothetical protein